MCNEPLIRLLKSDDANGLREFYNGLSSESLRLFLWAPWPRTSSAKEIARNAAGDRCDLVALAGDRVIAWAFLMRMQTDLPHLGIAVADDYQNKGLGRQLMSKLIERARRTGKKKIDLIVVQDNTRAQRLYQSFGFTMHGTRRGDDGQDYFEMALTLTPDQHSA